MHKDNASVDRLNAIGEKEMGNVLDVDVFVKNEIKALGVGSKEFFERHNEILMLIEASAKGVQGK